MNDQLPQLISDRQTSQLDRICRIGLAAMNSSSGLRNCHPASVAEGIIQASMLGLEVNDGTGRAWLIPYGNKAKFILGYKAVVDLAMRSNRVRGIWTYPVFHGEYFDVEPSDDLSLDDFPTLGDVLDFLAKSQG